MTGPRGSSASWPGGHLPPGFGAPLPPVTARQLQIKLPEDEPIPGAIEFNPSVTFASAGVGTTAPQIITQLPPNAIGVVRAIDVGILNLLQTSNVFWTLTVNDVPAPGWNNIPVFPGSVPRVTKSFDTMIRLPQAAKVAMTFTNNDGAAYPIVGMDYYGFFWTVQADRWWKGTAAG